MIKNVLMGTALVALVGCGSGDTLSQQQAQQALTAVGTASTEGVMAAATQIAAASGQVTVSANASCSGSGTVGVSGSATVNSSSSTYSLNVNLTFANCRVGNTTVSGTLSYVGNGSPQSITSSLTGQVTVSGDVAGTCSIDVDQSLTFSPFSYSLNGRACGRSVTVQFNQ